MHRSMIHYHNDIQGQIYDIDCILSIIYLEVLLRKRYGCIQYV